jgi:hypothetical protein
MTYVCHLVCFDLMSLIILCGRNCNDVNANNWRCFHVNIFNYMVPCFVVAVIDLGHRVIAVIPQRSEGLIIKITTFINVSGTFI